jgi:hypothetical protein
MCWLIIMPLHLQDDNRDACKQQQQQQQQDCDSPGRSARKAGKLLRPSQQQAQQQVRILHALIPLPHIPAHTTSLRPNTDEYD